MIPFNQDGDDVVIEKLYAPEQNLDDIVLYCFSPISMPGTPPITFLIKELVCKKYKDDLEPSLFQNVTVHTYRTSKKSCTTYELSVNGSCGGAMGVRKKITYQENGHVCSKEFRPTKQTSFRDVASMLWTVATFSKIGIGLSTGNPLSVASIPGSLMALTSSGHSYQPSIKNKKNWHISKPKTLSSKIALKYTNQFEGASLRYA